MEHGLVVMTNPKEPLCMVTQQETGFTLKAYGLRKTAYGHGHGLIAVGMTLVVVTGGRLLYPLCIQGLVPVSHIKSPLAIPKTVAHRMMYLALMLLPLTVLAAQEHHMSPTLVTGVEA
jgi:hypothetical protein